MVASENHQEQDNGQIATLENQPMYTILHFFLTGLFWGIYRGRVASDWQSFQTMIGFLVVCVLFTFGAIFLLFTTPLTLLGFAIAVIAGGVGAVIGYRAQG